MRRHVQIHLLTYLGSICVCMRQLNNRLFEELAMDVYDEVDRRENDAGEPPFSSPPVCLSGGGGLFPYMETSCYNRNRKHLYKTSLTWEEKVEEEKREKLQRK